VARGEEAIETSFNSSLEDYAATIDAIKITGGKITRGQNNQTQNRLAALARSSRAAA
jgi:hypothetical protein